MGQGEPETGRLGDGETEDDNGGPFDPFGKLRAGPFDPFDRLRASRLRAGVPALRACSGSQASSLREIGFVFSTEGCRIPDTRFQITAEEIGFVFVTDRYQMPGSGSA